VSARLPPTRASLLRARRRLERVERGVQVLRRRREALVRELFRVARPAADARVRIVEKAADAARALVEAGGEHGGAVLHALAQPSGSVEVELDQRLVWGVAVAGLRNRPSLARSLQQRGTAPALTGPAAAMAAEGYEELAELLLDAAPREMMLRRLGRALARTSRQLHQLEQRVAPRLESEIARVRGILDEREREERQRLEHVRRAKKASGTLSRGPLALPGRRS
jgi:V/A-type H+-transporting ATPase subunit D